jgi:hypothetical protein
MVRTTTKKTTKVVDTITAPDNVITSITVTNVVAASITADNIVATAPKVKKVIKSKKTLASAKEPNVIASTKEPVVLPVPEPEPVHLSTEVVKAKRGRKSKKDLLASLNAATAMTNVQLQINELNVNVEKNDTDITNIQTLSDVTDINVVISPSNEEMYDEEGETNENNTTDQKPAIKKRGRKPKGGKIIQQVVPLNQQKIDRPNVILHLKCSMKDLQSANSSCLIESFNFGNKNELSYELLNANNNESKPIQNQTLYPNANSNANDMDYDDDDDVVNKDNNKEIWRKLKQLEHNLHVNNINNKKSACFWCTSDFDNPPVYIPKHFINGTYHVYGCFCSPECGVAHLMNESIDSSTKFERYHLLNHIYSKIYEYKKNVKPAPNPYYMLDKFYGNLSIQEYRSLLRNERLFLIVDKPLTRILPELHEDNDEFILNNKIIPSNNYQLKSRMQKKKPNKGSILNEKFGLTNQSALILE